ncbi:hypothetical protein [Mucilaginibacter myungsuensis]|uniref:Uncharacterized protein n=1 Tax=Mucilaginibacter myungsuensis TaxID=649104 RepID=A0A929KVD1_9SPHI|nr:hypothetical protein [Mucilaginibacter myungsuensis]MBE9660593.1 hypothetical protein [Mucilaginibacter myungsuensis]MDN3600637.1 hypothetical protein [Mucilaginibacter myungsuensis]
MDHDANLSELLATSTEDPSDRDLVLTITDQTTTDNDNIYVAKAIYKSDTVGLKVSMPKKRLRTRALVRVLK